MMNETTSLLAVALPMTSVSSLSSSSSPASYCRSPACSEKSSTTSNTLANGVSSYQNDAVRKPWHDDEDEEEDDNENEEEEETLFGELLQIHGTNNRESSSFCLDSLHLYGKNGKPNGKMHDTYSSSRTGCIIFKTLLCLLLGCTLLMVARLALLHYVSPTSDDSTTQNLLWAQSSSSSINIMWGRRGGASRNQPLHRKKRIPHNVTISTKNVKDITFGELAQQLLPVYYDDMLSGLVAVMSDHVMPDEIYAQRKSVLETRDLMDVFSPVYPPTTTTGNKHEGSSHNKDMWVLLRSYLDEGYEILGEFQDLYASHANYTQQYFDKLQNEVLTWNLDFAVFREKHDISAYLQAPSLTNKHYQHGKVSRLFWNNVKRHLPRGNSPAVASLHMLGAQQINTTFQCMSLISPLTSVLDFESHAEYHEVRKLLRSIQDEYNLFGTVMFPNDSKNSTLSVMDEITTARKLLGDMNDHYTAYTIGILLNTTTAQEQERLANVIQGEWDYIQSWIKTSDLPGKLQALLRHLF
jgi:hypothetical protein